MSITLNSDCRKLTKALSPNDLCNLSRAPERPLALLFSHEAIVGAGDIPTPAEVATHLAEGKGFLVYIGNGEITPGDREAYDETASPTGYEITIKEKINFAGTVRSIWNSFLLMLKEQNANNQQLRVFVITKDGRFYGGKIGFNATVYFPHWQASGTEKANIQLEFSADVPMDLLLPLSARNSAYLNLENILTAGDYEITNEDAPDALTLNGFEGITGWSRISIPTLFLEHDPLTEIITVYATDADRIAVANEVATITNDGTVTEANVSGFGGEIDSFAGLLFTVADVTWTSIDY